MRYENLYCLPRAFGITDLIGMEGADKIRSALLTLQMNPASQAAVSKKDLEEIGTGNFARGSVSLLTYTSGKVILRTQFSGRGFVVLSDQYYPGWHAYIDDRPAKIYKTDGVLRGVVVPQGIHELRFGYQPGIIYALMGLSIITLTGTVIMLIKSRPSQSERAGNLNNTP